MGKCKAHGGGKRCMEKDCNKSAQGGTKRCAAHGGGRRCEEPGCTKGAQGTTRRCVAHGGGKKKPAVTHSPPLASSSSSSSGTPSFSAVPSAPPGPASVHLVQAVTTPMFDPVLPPPLFALPVPSKATPQHHSV